MIDQVRGDVHIPGAVPLTSEASRVVWTALSCDSFLAWHRGAINFSNDLEPDFASTGLMQALFSQHGIPAFHLDVLVSLDLEIPPAEAVLSSMDPHVTTLSFNSPGFNIPEEAQLDGLAVCLAASRIAWEIRTRLIRPTGVKLEDLETKLRGIGLQCLAVGGIAVYPLAKAILADPGLWESTEDNGGVGFDEMGE